MLIVWTKSLGSTIRFVLKQDRLHTASTALMFADEWEQWSEHLWLKRMEEQMTRSMWPRPRYQINRKILLSPHVL